MSRDRRGLPLAELVIVWALIVIGAALSLDASRVIERVRRPDHCVRVRTLDGFSYVVVECYDTFD